MDILAEQAAHGALVLIGRTATARLCDRAISLDNTTEVLSGSIHRSA